jgi:SAM-dependent methyltransferase
VFAKEGIWIRACWGCHHRWAEIASPSQHVAQVYGDDYFHGGGAGYSDYLSEGELLSAHARRYARILRSRMKPGRILDVGAAAGFLLRGFVEASWQGEGIEPNDRMASHARGQLGLKVHTGTLEELPTGEPFDVVSMIQVIAHFVDPVAALEAAARRTSRNGWWLVETWDRDSLTATLLGRHWHEYSPPSVLHWFSRRGLRSLVKRWGFRESAWGRPVKWLNAGHARSLLTHKLGPVVGRVLKLIPDRLALPYPSEDLFWTLYRREG